MKILALGAHADDIEIFMYGLLAICKNRGDEVFTIVATDGAKGGDNSDGTLIWDDPLIGINWQLEHYKITNPIISIKDQNALTLEQLSEKNLLFP